MLKKNQMLSFVDIVLNAEADVIQRAYEARVKIDGLLEEREKAYQQIAQLEEEIHQVVGESGSFPFPDPPIPVAGMGKAAPKKKASVAKKSAPIPVNPKVGQGAGAASSESPESIG